MPVFCYDTRVDFFDKVKYQTRSSMPYAHYHNHHELYYLVSGSVTFWVEDKIFELVPGNMIFVPKGLPHQTHYNGASNIERYLLIIDDDMIGNDYMKYIKSLSEEKIIRLLPASQHKIRSIYDKIEQEYTSPKVNSKEFKKLYLREILLSIDRYKITNTENQLSSTLVMIQEIINFINDNYNQDITVELLAKKYSLSKGYLSRQFKKYTGLPPIEYISLIKIQNAQRLLSSNTNKSITEIALECGYNNSAYFTRAFKKITGTTPKKYSGNANTHASDKSKNHS